MSKFEHMPSGAAKKQAPQSERGAFFTPQQAKGNENFLNEYEKFEKENGSSEQSTKEALVKKERYQAPDFQSFSRDVHNLEAELVKAVDAHSSKVGELIDRAKQMKEQAQTVVAEAYRRNLPREVITNFWQIENWLEQISTNPETTSRLIKQQHEANVKQQENEEETAKYSDVSQEDMQKDLLMKKGLNDLRQRIIAEYGIDPEKDDQEMGLGSKLKHLFSKLSSKGSLVDQYKKMKLEAAGEEPIELPMKNAVPEIVEDLRFKIPTRDSKDIPMANAKDIARDALSSFMPGVDSLSEVQSKRLKQKEGETIQSRTRSGQELEDEMLGANFDTSTDRKAFRQKAADQMKKIAERSKKQETPKVVLAPDLEEEIEQLASGKEQIQQSRKAKKQRELDEPVNIPMSGRAESLLRDAAASIIPGVESLPEKQARKVREQQGESVTPKTDNVDEFEKSFFEDSPEESAEEAPESINIPMSGRAESLLRDAAASIIPGVESLPEKQARKVREQDGETVHSRTRNGKKLEEDFLGKESEQFAPVRKELLALANSKGSETNLVKELNTKTGDAFFKEAPDVWEKAYGVAQKNLEAAGESKRTGLESKAQQLATDYVMAFARLKAAELGGLSGKELSAFQKAALASREAIYTKRTPEPFHGMKVDDYRKYIKGKRKPLEATPERKPVTTEDEDEIMEVTDDDIIDSIPLNKASSTKSVLDKASRGYKENPPVIQDAEDEFEKLPEDMEIYPKKAKKPVRKV